MSPPSEDYFIVSGIGTETAVESIHVVAHSSTAEKAHALLLSSLKENKSITPTSCEELDEDVMADCQVDELFEQEAPVIATTGTRKELRATRKQKIEKHLALKPSIHSQGKVAAANGANFDDKLEASELSLESLAKHIASIENELLSIQTNFNNQLLDAARDKISIRDDIIHHNVRLEEIHHLLKAEGKAERIDTRISFLQGEYTEYEDQRARSMLDGARKLYKRNTIHDPAFILHGDADLSENAVALKLEATNSLEHEIKHLIEQTHAQIEDFDKGLSQLMRAQIELKQNLMVRKLLLVVKEKQMLVMLDHESKVEQLKNIGLDHDDFVSQMKTALETRNKHLEKLEVLSPINISDFVNEACDKPMLIHRRLGSTVSKLKTLAIVRMVVLIKSNWVPR